MSRVIVAILAGGFLHLGGAAVASAQDAVVEAIFPGAHRDQAVPTPSSFLGHPLGSLHTLHADAVRYAEAVAQATPRVEVQSYGKSFGGRDLVKVVIAAPALQARRQELRETARQVAEGQTSFPAGHPVTVWFGMSIHGNEASGVEAGLLLLYHLASDMSDATKTLLEHTVLCLDLDQNPDGRDRYVTGIRDRMSLQPQGWRGAWDHYEPWPGARGNHYLFDLNRDWYLQTQVESRQRVREVLQELPQVMADFHEMGSDRTYYFSTPPGPPVSVHISTEVRENWRLIGREIAAAFDRRQWPYWTADTFPADHPGYGGAWPCFLGAAGMTFEQASAKGGRVDRDDGTVLTLREAMERHAVAGMATLEAASSHREAILARASAHFGRVRKEGTDDPLPTFLLTPRYDPDRLQLLRECLERNGIHLQYLEEGLTVEAHLLPGGARESHSVPAGSVVVSTRQPLRPLVLALLDPEVGLDQAFLQAEAKRRAERKRSEIYDVTAWNLPLLFGVETLRAPALPAGTSLRAAPLSGPEREGKEPDQVVAYLAPGRQLRAAALLGRLLKAGLRVRVAPFEFSLEDRSCDPGTLVVLLDRNREDALREVLHREVAAGEPLWPVSTCMTREGHDLGSGRTLAVMPPSIAVAAGPGVSATSFGAIRWLLEEAVPLEHRCFPLEEGLERSLEEATVLVLPDGNGYDRRLPKERLTGFLERGGTIVALRGAAAYLATEAVGLLPLEPAEKLDDLRPVPGAVLAASLEVDHWICLGLPARVSVLSRAQTYWTPVAPADARTVASFAPAEDLCQSGLLLEEQAAALAGAPLVVEKVHGRGRVVAFLEDVVYRGCSPGTWRLFLNACLLGPSQSRP